MSGGFEHNFNVLNFSVCLHYAKKARANFLYLTKEDMALSKFKTYILSGLVLMLIAIAFILYVCPHDLEVVRSSSTNMMKIELEV